MKLLRVINSKYLMAPVTKLCRVSVVIMLILVMFHHCVLVIILFAGIVLSVTKSRQ